MLLIIIGLIALSIVTFTLIEYKANNRVNVLPSNPFQEFGEEKGRLLNDASIYAVMVKLEEGEPLDAADLQSIEYTCRFIDKRYDCADFRVLPLIRMMFLHKALLNPEVVERIKHTLLGFKFFMDQPGNDSMCLWSENHIAIFATCEYLIGQLYPEDILTNDGKKGIEHKDIAKERLLFWLKHRYQYGFSEWYSNTYYEEDIGPLSCLIDFCDDEEITIKATIIMDLLLHDVATQMFNGCFNSTSGRQYELGKKSGVDSSMSSVIEKIWGFPSSKSHKSLDQLFIYINNYQVPEVIKAIGLDDKDRVVKASSGLDVSEFKKEFADKTDTESVIMQWSMEAFSNPEVISDSVKYIRKFDLLSNEFLNSFKDLNLRLLQKTPLLSLISKQLNPVSNGVALQRANTYTYRTKYFMLATAQNYHPGDFGDQQHISSAVLPNNICVFTTHPASPLSPDGALGLSPNYWVGNGRNPHSAQHKAVNLSLYVLDEKKGFMEKSVLKKTHCFFPIKKFDEVRKSKKLIVGRIENSFIAIHGLSNLEMSEDEIIQNGKVTGWITELSSNCEESFDDFCKRMKSAVLKYDSENKALKYISGTTYVLEYKKGLYIEGNKQDSAYERFDSPYSYAKRKSDGIEINHNNHELLLDFNNKKRNHS